MTNIILLFNIKKIFLYFIIIKYKITYINIINLYYYYGGQFFFETYVKENLFWGGLTMDYANRCLDLRLRLDSLRTIA